MHANIAASSACMHLQKLQIQQHAHRSHLSVESTGTDSNKQHYSTDALQMLCDAMSLIQSTLGRLGRPS